MRSRDQPNLQAIIQNLKFSFYWSRLVLNTKVPLLVLDFNEKRLFCVQYDTTKTGFGPAQNLNSGSDKKDCAVVLKITSRRQRLESIIRFMTALFLFGCLFLKCQIHVLGESLLWVCLHFKELFFSKKNDNISNLSISNKNLIHNHLVS